MSQSKKNPRSVIWVGMWVRTKLFAPSHPITHEAVKLRCLSAGPCATSST